MRLFCDRKKGDVVREKTTTVKQKAMKRDTNLDDFTAIPAVMEEGEEDFLRFDEMHLSRPLLKGISVREWSVSKKVFQTIGAINLRQIQLYWISGFSF